MVVALGVVVRAGWAVSRPASVSAAVHPLVVTAMHAPSPAPRAAGSPRAVRVRPGGEPQGHRRRRRRLRRRAGAWGRRGAREPAGAQQGGKARNGARERDSEWEQPQGECERESMLTATGR